jgi:hypothetical protein
LIASVPIPSQGTKELSTYNLADSIIRTPSDEISKEVTVGGGKE